MAEPYLQASREDKMKFSKLKYIAGFVGLFMLILGIYLAKSNMDPQGVMRPLPFILIGIGCGMFGQGMGTVISDRTLRNAPEIQRKVNIEKNDERNIAIANRAKGKAFDTMTYVFGALMVAFALMGVELTAVLFLVFSYVLVQGAALYYRFRLEREM